MCGIIGGLNVQHADRQSLGLDMLEQVRHRGPDQGFLHLEDEVFLGVRRLAIVNVAHGKQPAFSEDGQIIAVFNGEIYNHVELKKQLIEAGHQIPNGSDVEVIPHAYEAWGIDFPSHFNGDFAIALWDSRQGRLLLARDRLGIKPLYYTPASGGLLFGSEIKALFCHPGVSRELDLSFLSQIFTYWTGVDGGSAFLGVKQVEAAHVLEFDRSGQETRRHQYWDIPFHQTAEKFQGSFAQCCEAFRAELRKSVALRLQADVEVGAYTSGGIDSAAINVVAYGDLGHSARQTFSVAFEDAAFDESEQQRTVANALGLHRHEVRVRNEDIYRSFTDVIYHTESPIFRTAPAPMFLLSQAVQERGVKVVLTGEGSDEIAWGYDLFREAKLRRFWSRQPNSQARPQLFKKLYAYLPQFQNKRHFQLLVDFFRRDMERTDDPLYSHQTRIANSSGSHTMLDPRLQEQLREQPPTQTLTDSLPTDFPERSLLERCQYLEMRTLLHGYLLSSQGDRMLSAHGVEGRFPFLDHHLIEFLAGVPERYKLRGLKDKAIVRESFRRDLPPSIFNRPKFAFRAPELSVFLEDSEDLLGYYLSEQAVQEAGVFNSDAVQHFRRRLKQTPPDRFSTRDNLALIQMLSTQVLHDQFVRRFEWNKARPKSQDVVVTQGGVQALRRAG